MRVTIVQEPCASYDTEELAAILRLELRAMGVPELTVVPLGAAPRSTEAGLALIHLSCRAENVLIAEVADLATGNQLKRELPFESVARAARPRALALAVALMIETSWLELATRSARAAGELNLPPEVRAALRSRLAFSLLQEERPLPPSPPEPPKIDMRGDLVALFVEGRSFPSRTTGLLGLQLASLPRLGPIRLWLTADAAYGTVSLTDSNAPAGHVRLYWLSAGLGATWNSDTQPELGIGPYARIAYAHADVRLDSSYAGFPLRDRSGVVVLLGVQAQLRAALSERTFALIACDLGYAVGGVAFLAHSGQSAGLADLSLGLRLGLGY